MSARLNTVARAAAQRPWLLVAAAYVVTAGYLVARVSKVDEYIWFVDELLYVKTAQAFADGELLRAEVYDGSVGLPNSLYPRLLAPFYWLLGSVGAFDAAHVLNAALFASVIFPVYLLARRLDVGWGLALLAALISAWVPWSVAAAVLMTESLAYPAFAWALLAIVAAIDSPGTRNHLLALLAIGVAAFARAQFALLLGVLVAGVVLEALARQNAHVRGGGRPPLMRDALRPHLPLAVMLGGVGIALALLAATGLVSLGIYDVAVESTRFPEGWLGAAGRHLGTIVVGVGVLPAVLWVAWMARALIRPRSRSDLAFALAGALAAGALIYAAADFAQNVSGGTTQERYLFYIVPVFVVGAAALLADARPPTPRMSVIAAGLLVAAIVTVPRYGTPEFGGAFGYIAAAASGFHPVVVGRADQLTTLLLGQPLSTTESVALLTVALGVITVPLLLKASWRPVVAPGLLTIVLLFTAAETIYVFNRAVPGINAQSQRLPGIPETPRAWADDAVDGDAEIAALPGPIIEPPQPVEREIWLRAEFWNKQIQTSYTLPGRTNYTNFRSVPLSPDPSTGRVAAAQEVPFVVVSATDPGLRLRGEVVAAAAYGLELLQPQRPYRALWLAEGGFVDGYTEGTRPRVLHLYEPRSRASFDLTAPGTAERPVGYVVRVGGREQRGTVKPGFTRTVRLALDPGDTRIEIRPDLATTLEDGQRVGIRVGPLELG